MRKYVDDYKSFIYDFDYDRDIKELKFPFIRPSECFNVESKRGNFTTKYIRLNVGLDIETTEVDGLSAPYIMSASLNKPHSNIFYCYHFRRWEGLQEFFERIAKRYGCGYMFWDRNEKKYKPYKDFARSKRVLLCYICNASFEFAFCRQELKFAHGEYDFFSKESRKMMKANLECGIELRDTTALTNSGLMQTARDFCLHQKVKDLDYSIPRNTLSWDSIRPDEWRYINDDVIILNEFEDYIFDHFVISGKKIPLTNTARLLLKVEQKAGPRAEKERERVQKIQPKAREVILASRYLFRGGYVHGNIRYIDCVRYCLMKDITSSYPYVILTKYMPDGKFVSVELSKNCWCKGKEPADFFDLLYNQCLIIDATYYNLRAITDHSYESVSKVKDVIFENQITDQDNGRIRRAISCRVVQTELDYNIYQMLYDFDCVEIHSIRFAGRAAIPDFLQECVADAYKKKDALKKAGKKDTPEYALAKIDVNSFFGMLCKSVYDTNIGYDYEIGDWVDKPQSDEDIQKDLDNRFLQFYHGVWVCAHARYKLIDMICRVEALGGHILYYDTDSLKFIPDKEGRVEALFEYENHRIQKERRNFPLLQDPAFWGKDGNGLGEWANENPVDEHGKYIPVPFKTLGAKRYLYIDDQGTPHLCVAGLPKCAADSIEGDPFEMFNLEGFRFEAEKTGKLRPVYHDEPYDVTITDPQGRTETIHCKTGVTLVPVDFVISEKRLYSLVMQHKDFIRERRSYLEKEKVIR